MSSEELGFSQERLSNQELGQEIMGMHQTLRLDEASLAGAALGEVLDLSVSDLSAHQRFVLNEFHLRLGIMLSQGEAR